jgi:hypothetical protein
MKKLPEKIFLKIKLFSKNKMAENLNHKKNCSIASESSRNIRIRENFLTIHILKNRSTVVITLFLCLFPIVSVKSSDFNDDIKMKVYDVVDKEFGDNDNTNSDDQYQNDNSDRGTNGDYSGNIPETQEDEENQQSEYSNDSSASKRKQNNNTNQNMVKSKDDDSIEKNDHRNSNGRTEKNNSRKSKGKNAISKNRRNVTGGKSNKKSKKNARSMGKKWKKPKKLKQIYTVKNIDTSAMEENSYTRKSQYTIKDYHKRNDTYHIKSYASHTKSHGEESRSGDESEKIADNEFRKYTIKNRHFGQNGYFSNKGKCEKSESCG